MSPCSRISEIPGLFFFDIGNTSSGSFIGDIFILSPDEPGTLEQCFITLFPVEPKLFCRSDHFDDDRNVFAIRKYVPLMTSFGHKMVKDRRPRNVPGILG